jgi:hypothetical protein
MKKILIALALCAAAAQASAATAIWNGQIEWIQTVTYQQAVRCGYNYLGQMFTQVFIASSCPPSIEVQ